MSRLDEKTVRAQLRRWILDHTKVIVEGGLADDTAILDRGILSSLDVVEFVLFIESLRGAEVDTDAIAPEVFTSVDTLWKEFFAPLAGAAERTAA